MKYLYCYLATGIKANASEITYNLELNKIQRF